MSLLFNMLSRLVITFLPRSKCLLISWLQSPSAVILKVKVKSLSHVQLFATPWTVAHHASPSMEFSRQEYWSGLPFLSPGDLPNPGIEPGSPALQEDFSLAEPQGKSSQPLTIMVLASEEPTIHRRNKKRNKNMHRNK